MIANRYDWNPENVNEKIYTDCCQMKKHMIIKTGKKDYR